MSLLRAKRICPKSLLASVLCSFILVHLLLNHQHNANVWKEEQLVESLKDISEDLSTIHDDDPKLLNYLRTQKITYPDNSVKRKTGEPELGQVYPLLG